jgi:hypothetical protein
MRVTTQLLLVPLVVTLAAFGFRTYFAGAVTGDAAVPHPLVHLHAGVAVTWLAFWVVQVALVASRRTAVHRRLGIWVGIPLAATWVATALGVALAAPAARVAAGDWTPDEAAAFLILPLGDVVLVVGFVASALLLRHRQAVHRRLVWLAMVAASMPAVGRLAQGHLTGTFALWAALIVAGLAVERWREGRLHPLSLAGAAVLAAAYWRVLLAESAPWLGVGRPLLRLTLSTGAAASGSAQ